MSSLTSAATLSEIDPFLFPGHVRARSNPSSPVRAALLKAERLTIGTTVTVPRNKIERVRIDVEFHSMLYEMSENTTILQFQKMLLPVFDYVNNGLHVRSQVRTKDYASHRVLLTILQNGTPEEFRNKMKSHLMQYFEKV